MVLKVCFYKKKTLFIIDHAFFQIYFHKYFYIVNGEKERINNLNFLDKK